MTRGRGRSARSEPRAVPAAVLIGAVVLAVVAVSVPRLQHHVVSGNAAEAPRSLLLVGAVHFDDGADGAAPSTLDVDALLGDRWLEHRLVDARRAGARLLHHGYLIDAAIVPDGRRALLAWPSRYGRTGGDAYVLTEDGEILAHPNEGRWSGAESPLTGGAVDGGWSTLRSSER